MKNFFRIVLLISFFAPIYSSAVTGADLITSWVSPEQSASYQFTTHVVLEGTWQMPPGWGGYIEVYQDGMLMTNILTSENKFNLDNTTGVATTSGPYAFDIGPQPDGTHSISIKFWGGTECAINRALNEINAGGISDRTPECVKSSANFAPNIGWLERTFTVALPQYPRMVISPSSDPALNFLNVVFGTKPTKIFTVSNTGNETLTGSLSLTAPYTCSPCSYTVNPNGSKDITVTFSPQTSPEFFGGTATFSCNGTSHGCDGAAYVLTNQVLNIQGNSVNNSVAPVLTLSPTSINYGTVHLGVAITDRDVVVRNTGGGILNGFVTFSTPAYSCTLNPTCSYSLFAGEQTTIKIHYVPTIAGSHTDNAGFSGGLGANLPLSSFVNDLPIVTLSTADPTGLSYPPKVNVGQCRDVTDYVRNSGASTLSGSITGIPIASLPTDKLPGFSCVENCTYTNLLNTSATAWAPATKFRFCPVDANPVQATVTFTNSLNPSASSSVTLYGQGNELPLGQMSGTMINFPNTLVGKSSTSTISVWNSGVGALVGTVGPSVSDAAHPGVFRCVYTNAPGSTDCSFNIAENATVVFTFVFTPATAMTYPTDSFNFNFPDGTKSLGVTGTGVKPNFKMSYVNYPDLPGVPPASIYPPGPLSYDVGSTIFGGSASVQNKKFYFYVKNTGSGASVNYSFPDAPHFVYIGGGSSLPRSGVLAPGVQGYVAYEFRPDSATAFSEAIEVDYDYGDGDFPHADVTLQGASVVVPYLSVLPNTNIDLGPVVVGATSTATFTVTNLGVGSLDGNVTIPSLTGTDPMSGLVSRWTFDTANINWTTHAITDVAGGGNTAYLPGPRSAIGKYGEALDFYGNGGMKTSNISQLGAGNALHTTAMWIKINALPGWPGYRAWIAELGSLNSGSEHFLISNTGATQFGVWSGVQCHPSLASYVGTWVHVALVNDGSNLKCYVNGVLKETVVGTNYNFGATKSLLLADGNTFDRTYGYYDSDFNGQLDDVRVYNRALNASEITQVYANSITPTGMVLRYAFDDPSVVWSQMKVIDSSGYGNDAFLASIPSSVSGKIKEASSFNGGLYNYVHVSNSANLNPGGGKMSMSLWFKANAIGSLNASILYSKENLFEASAGGGYFTYAWQPHWNWDGDTSFPITVGQWYHAIIVYDGLKQYLYKDGQLVYSRVQTGSMGSNGNRLGFGTRGFVGGGQGPFTGEIDDVRIYNRALSASEASDLYQSGLSGGISSFACATGCIFNNLLNGQSQPVTIEFSPSEAIGYIAYPLFSSNGGNIGYPAAPYPSVSGTGVMSPLIDLSPPTDIGFSETNLGLSNRKDLVITNVGLGDLIGNVSPVRSTSISFYCLSNCNFNLPPGASTTAVIEFSPVATGTPVMGTINVNSNATNGILQTLNVFGDAKFAPIIDIRGADTDFSKVIVSKRKTKTFIVDNTNSTVDLGTGAFLLTGPFRCIASDAGFDVAGNCLYNLNAGTSVTITVEFAPTAVGGPPVNAGYVSLSNIPLARFFIQGIGVPPTIKFIEN